jgi:hypothetical protein
LFSKLTTPIRRFGPTYLETTFSVSSTVVLCFWRILVPGAQADPVNINANENETSFEFMNPPYFLLI